MPRNISPEQIAREWRALCERYPLDLRQHVQAVVNAQRQALATAFYARMLPDPTASFFLSDELVKTRLNQAMQQWLQEVFEVGVSGDFESAVNRQRTVGEVHARIGIPAYVVMRGVRRLDQEIYDLLAADGCDTPMAGATYVAQTTGLAIEIMCHSYAVSHERNARAEESYRMFAMAHDIGAEKERQRAALLDWENQLIFEISTRISAAAGAPASTGNAAALPLLGKSEFGLWFAHKASHAFEGAPDLPIIAAQVAEIDQLLSGSAEPAQPPTGPRLAELMGAIRQKAKSIGFLVDQLFQQAGHLESGRDTLTRLLNRKYLQVIMTREIDFARRNDAALSVLAIDIDFFKRINDNHGHDAGDAVLQEVAQNLVHALRSGDYIFRLGGEEFLVVLVDVEHERAWAIAETLCKRMAAERLQLPGGQTLQVTVSIGVATHDGHPDYQRLLKGADQALYQAKSGGRNRVASTQMDIADA
ncbi:signaling protein [Bordetella ansorpii]|uniref:Diguanylate cyclase DosC n=1 Tax=Bordetella ansorpii TaxID=288768 RepID=A0A157SVW9_9BORD|nr:diguanylate cyclase [Bordetella ansorpii]SAI74610.1 signaling protein [Bordetella ansorpii]